MDGDVDRDVEGESVCVLSVYICTNGLEFSRTFSPSQI